MQYGVPQTLPRTFRCGNHPDREGVGICVNCRQVICIECSTKIDQMNYCISCLRAAAPETAAENRGSDTALGIPLLFLSFGATAVIFMALGFLLAFLRSGGGVSPP